MVKLESVETLNVDQTVNHEESIDIPSSGVKISRCDADLLEELMLKLSKIQNLYISNRATFEHKISKMRMEKPLNMQVITDFDRTFSAYKYPNGTKSVTTYLAITGHKDEVFHMRQKSESLSRKYVPIEFDKNMSVEEKKPKMIEWWALANQIITSSGMTRKDVQEASLTAGIHIRNGFYDLVRDFVNIGIPVLVASAGLGDVIYYKLLNDLGCLDNIEIVSNFLIYDEDDVVTGISEPMVHSYNKHIIPQVARHHFDKHQFRKNIIVIGDSLGDVDMIKLMPPDVTALKIGFLNCDVEIALQTYLNIFDVVLADPYSLIDLLPIFEYLMDNSNSAS